MLHIRPPAGNQLYGLIQHQHSFLLFFQHKDSLYEDTLERFQQQRDRRRSGESLARQNNSRGTGGGVVSPWLDRIIAEGQEEEW